VAKTDLPDAGIKLINRGKSWMNLMLFENQSTIQIVLEK
jgi:hypothetical protein